MRRMQLAGHLVELDESTQLRALEEGDEGEREPNGDQLVPAAAAPARSKHAQVVLRTRGGAGFAARSAR